MSVWGDVLDATYPCVFVCVYVQFVCLSFVLFITAKDLLSHVDVCQVEILFITIAILVAALGDRLNPSKH